MKDTIVYEHKCLRCYKYFEGKKRAEQCPKCGQWHISMVKKLAG